MTGDVSPIEDPGVPLQCACIGIALERSFYSTFFGTSEFVSVKDRLIGRSMTNLATFSL